MDAGGGAGGGAHAKAAIEQGVIILKTVIDPSQFGKAFVGGLDFHVRRRLFAEISERKLGSPDVVVSQLEQIDIHYGYDHHRPWPVVFVEFEQAALLFCEFGNGRDRRGADLKRRLVVEDEDGSEGVAFAAYAEYFVFGIDGVNYMRGVDGDQFGFYGLLCALVARRRRRKRFGHPVEEGEGDVEVFGGLDVWQFGDGAVDMRIARIPA